MDLKPEDVSNFRTARYADLNRLRWEQFLSMDISLEGKTIFEPGAGIGDQTEWLLQQSALHIFVQEGREENLAIIRERFENNRKVTILPSGNLETCLPEMPFHGLDLVYCYGVYYHINENLITFPIMRELATIGEMIVVEYLEGNDTNPHFTYEDNSTSISGTGCRPRHDTLLKGLKDTWGFAYKPKNQLRWCDPLSPEIRLIAVGSKSTIVNEQLDQFWPDYAEV